MYITQEKLQDKYESLLQAEISITKAIENFVSCDIDTSYLKTAQSQVRHAFRETTDKMFDNNLKNQ